MTSTTISHLRLQHQQIGSKKLSSVKELVHWMGAVQAQDYAMSKYAIGARIKNATDATIEEAINRADIIRTHVLRPTWHFIAAEDAGWMLELTAKNLNRVLSSNNKRLELDEKTFRKANTIIGRLLRNGKHLTRKEIMTVLEKKGIKTNDLRAIHIMFRAETDRVVCNGIKREKQFTYALFDERVLPGKKLSKEEALAELALRYFLSHGPATIQDFTWWSGLPVTDAKQGLELVQSKLISEKFKDNIVWLSPHTDFKKNNSLFFLPSYDEFLISYKSREISLDLANVSKTFTINGIFNPVIVQNARVIGTWKAQFRKELHISAFFFQIPNQKQIQLCIKAAKKFGEFVNNNVLLFKNEPAFVK